MNLLDLIQRQVRAHPERTAVIDEDKTLTFRDLWERVRMVSLRLAEEGIRRGDCVAVSGLLPRGRLVLFMALARMGASSISIQVSMPRATRDLLFAQSKAVAWVVRETVDDPGIAPRTIAPETLFVKRSSGKPASLVSGLQNDVWRIALSSGTTGVNKCIPWTHGEIAQAQRLGHVSFPGGPRERLMIAVDITINLALGHCVRQLSAGGAVVLPKSLEPVDIAQSIRNDRPTRILSTPSVAAVFATQLDKLSTPGAFDSVLSVYLGGGVVVPKLRAQLEERLCPNIVVLYGSTEMATTARGDSALALEFPQATGRLLPWIEAQALDEQGEPLPPGQMGVLRFRSPAMASHYLDNPKATAAAFRDGWYYPGDKGSVDETGVLTLGGRTDDVLNLNGLKIDPTTVEAVLDTHPAIRQSAVTTYRNQGGNDILVVLLVPQNAFDADAEASIRKHLTNAAGVLYSLVRIVPVSELPRTPVGKLARARLPAIAAQAPITKL